MILKRLLIITLLTFISATAFAKDRLILMPVGGAATASLGNIYRAALSEALGIKYEVLSGTQIDKKITEIWKAESKKVNCSEEACYKAAVIAFQAELMAKANVEEVDGGYMLSFQVMNLLENKQVYSRQLSCKGCDKFGLVDKLKKLGNIPTKTTTYSGPSIIQEVTSDGKEPRNYAGRAALFIDSEPSDAAVFIDNKQSGKTPYQNLKLREGQTLDLTLKKNLYHSTQLSVTLQAGMNEPPIVMLRPNFGKLSVNVTPAGSTISVSQNSREVTTLSSPGSVRLSPGEYQVVVSHEGYAQKIYRVTVDTGRTARLHGKILRQKTGKLMISSKPFEKGAKVFVDGKQRGKVPIMLTLSAGKHTVEVRGAKDSGKETVRITDGGDEVVAVRLSGGGGSPGKSKTVAGIEFIWIPKGSFMMGSPASEANRDKDEKQHRVNLTQGYWLGETEVTKGQFKQFVRATAYKTTAEKEGSCWIYDGEWQNKSGYSWKKLGFSQSDDHPVVCVSWHDAKAYIKWLNRQGQGRFSLPTEAQWEYAARAGTTTAYSVGNDASQLGKYAWYSKNSGKKTQAVASKKPNPWGLYDMHGNVWEWTADWYDETYPSETTTDPTGSRSGSDRVLRGGSWYNYAQYLRSANRYGSSLGYRNYYIGFRLLLRTP
jgi:formylglycine-generating enzyme required for sulfatase activity